jgi:PilZ domain
MRGRMADRRGRPRFEIVGQLWGTMETVVAMTLRNVGHGGALVESEVPLPSNSEHHVTVTCEGVHSPMQVRVRHVEKTQDANGRLAYLIGLEFVTLGAALRAQIDLWLGTGSAQPGLSS